VRAALAVLLVLSSSTARADGTLRLEVQCDEAAPAEALRAALALELDATAWRLDDATDTDATVTIDADPCATTSPLRIAIDAHGRALVLDAVMLPERERARAIALLVADLVAGWVPESSAPEPAPAVEPSAPREPSPPATTFAVITAPAPREHPTADPVLPLGVEVTLALTHRWYTTTGTVGDGARVALTRPIPAKLRVSLSAELDEARTAMGFSLRTGRGGAQLSGRARYHRLALDLGARVELAHYTVLPELMTQTLDVRSPWTAGVTGVATAELDLFAGLSAHVSVESGTTVISTDVVREYTGPQAPPPDAVDVLRGRYTAISAGLTLR
jgi:hypothetical protein